MPTRKMTRDHMKPLSSNSLKVVQTIHAFLRVLDDVEASRLASLHELSLYGTQLVIAVVIDKSSENTSIKSRSKSWTCEDWVDTSGYPATTSPDIELTTGHSSSRTTAMLPQISRIEFTEEFRDWTRRIAYESVCVREVVKIFKQIKGIPGYSLRVVLCPCLCPYGGSRESSESVVMLPETCFKQPAQNGTTVSKMAKNGHFGRPLGAKHFFSSLNLRPGFHQLMSECAGRFQDCISSSLWSLLKCTSPSSLNECQKFILMVKTDQRNKTVPFVGDFLEESCFFFSHVFRFENSFGSLRNYENVNVDPYRRPNADGYRVVARSPVWKYLAILLSDKS
ncbi:hypothetical protein Tco_0804013 [Tanacetum coccineum]|uniref:Uncharacterized protein n=1 Tax=Tanacetum coccineum TaxID=301880 RepID=A0ABQ5A7F2_9ASTR